MEHPSVLTNLGQVMVYHPTNEVGSRDKGSIVAIVLGFREADLLVEANPDNDEAVVRVGRAGELQHWRPDDVVARHASADPHWSFLMAAGAAWWWQLTKPQGYRDGVQIELRHGAVTTTRPRIAAASHLHEAAVGS